MNKANHILPSNRARDSTLSSMILISSKARRFWNECLLTNVTLSISNLYWFESPLYRDPSGYRGSLIKTVHLLPGINLSDFDQEWLSQLSRGSTPASREHQIIERTILIVHRYSYSSVIFKVSLSKFDSFLSVSRNAFLRWTTLFSPLPNYNSSKALYPTS